MHERMDFGWHEKNKINAKLQPSQIIKLTWINLPSSFCFVYTLTKIVWRTVVLRPTKHSFRWKMRLTQLGIENSWRWLLGTKRKSIVGPFNWWIVECRERRGIVRRCVSLRKGIFRFSRKEKIEHKALQKKKYGLCV